MADTVSVNSVFLHTDVICVKFLNNFVLAGVGGVLKVFSLTSKTCLADVEVFKGHKIYGITNYRSRLLIFGNKCICIYKFSNPKSGVHLSCIASLSLEDWILSAHWLHSGTEVIIITAHNVAWMWPWTKGKRFPVQRADCQEKCILYSATVCGDDWTNCVVFAGTVFREVVVWLPQGVGNSDRPVLHRLTGHNGVIFSLTWDWQSSSLCSTSDDRSVRLWDFSFSNKSDWSSSSVRCSNVFYGHSARVWRSIIFQEFIISVGEDSQICIWDRKGNLLQSLERSTSGCQWSVDCSSKHQVMVTGAGDGSIQLLPLPSYQATPIVYTLEYPKILTQEKDCPCFRKLIFLSSGIIIAVSNDGTVFKNLSTSTLWGIVVRDERFSNYCILSVAPDRTIFSLASLKGLIVLYQGFVKHKQGWRLEQTVEDGKICSVVWLSNEEILVCGVEGRLSVWKLSQNPGGEMMCIGRFTLPRSRERWTTSGILLKQDNQEFLVCGDRCGSLHLFGIPVSISNTSELPDHSLPKLHGKLGVTSLVESENCFFSTGRDGTVRTLGINPKLKQLFVMSTDKMLMDWVCCVLPLSPNHKNCLVVGFKEVNMIIWSTNERRVILQLDCGGGHRSWDCMKASKKGKEKLEIAFVREKKIYCAAWALDALTKPTLLNGISPRELNCAHIFPQIPASLLLGGEDGTMYFCKFSNDFSCIESKLTLTSHISSVRCICVHNNFVFSAGGRAQLKAWKIEHSCNEEILCIELASHMLKGERHPRSPPTTDAEMRYMSICSIPSAGTLPIVNLVAGCSDGALRWLTFDPASKNFQVVGESMFHTKCVLKLLTVPLDEGQIMLISSATNGRIALWDVDPEMFTASHSVRQPVWDSHCHHSGVNSLHAIYLPGSERSFILIASGGDDNSVVLSALCLRQKAVSLAARWSSSSAHAAQVTGVWLIGKWLLSTSIDQRLTLWSWALEVEDSQLSCQFVHQTICSVPDIQDMQIWKTENYLYACVIGKGVQILSIPVDQKGT